MSKLYYIWWWCWFGNVLGCLSACSGACEAIFRLIARDFEIIKKIIVFYLSIFKLSISIININKSIAISIWFVWFRAHKNLGCCHFVRLSTVDLYGRGEDKPIVMHYSTCYPTLSSSHFYDRTSILNSWHLEVRDQDISFYRQQALK